MSAAAGNPLRIVMLSEYFEPEIGAAPVRVSAVARTLARRGHDVTVVTALPNYPAGRIADGYRRRLWCREQRDGVEVHRFWVYPAVGAGIGRYVNYLSFTLLCLLALPRLRRADIVVAESPPLTIALAAVVFRRALRAKLVLNVADLWPDTVVRVGLVEGSSWVARLAYRLERFAYRHADAINFVTEGMGRTLEEDKAIAPGRLLFLPNGVDTERFQPQVPDPDLARSLGVAGRTVFLYAGTHSVVAGMEVLVETAEILRSRGRQDIVIVCVGDGPVKPDLVAAARSRHLDNLVFVDPVQPAEVARLYGLAAAGLLTLLDNSMLDDARPAKIYPAMAGARPVVFSGRGEAARMIEEHRCGIVVAPQDGRAMADAIERIADDPEGAATMGAAGRALVEARFSWQAIVEDWETQARRALALTTST